MRLDKTMAIKFFTIRSRTISIFFTQIITDLQTLKKLDLKKFTNN